MKDKKDLINLEKELLEVSSCYNEISESINSLETDSKVAEYIRLNDERCNKLTEYRKLKSKYIQLKQETCSHDIFYFLSSETDSYEGRTYWTCKCLDCGYEITSRSNYITKPVIIEDAMLGFENKCLTSYYEVKETYQELKNDNSLSNSDVVEKMLSLFNEQRTKKYYKKR